MNSLIKVIDQWRTQGVRLLPPEPKRRVVAIFERFDVRPSDQVVQKYSLIGGFEMVGQPRISRNSRPAKPSRSGPPVIP